MESSATQIPPASTPATGLASWSFAQKATFALAVFQLGWATAGFIAEPTFATGSDAPSEQVLGVDFNGWHALSGFLLFGPMLIVAVRRSWAVLYALAAAGALIATGVWATLSNEVAIVFSFPNNEADAVLHLTTGFLLLGIVAIQARRDGGLRESLRD